MEHVAITCMAKKYPVSYLHLDFFWVDRNGHWRANILTRLLCQKRLEQWFQNLSELMWLIILASSSEVRACVRPRERERVNAFLPPTTNVMLFR